MGSCKEASSKFIHDTVQASSNTMGLPKTRGLLVLYFYWPPTPLSTPTYLLFSNFYDMWTKIVNTVKGIVLCAWINSPTHSPSPPPALAPHSTTVELSGVISGAVPAAPNPTDNHNGNLKEWPLLVIGVCLAAAALGLQAIQTFETLPLSFNYFCVALHFSYCALIVSTYIRSRYPPASLVMEHVSIFSGSTAFTVIIATNLQTPFMLILFAVYLISILIIIFVSLFGPRT